MANDGKISMPGTFGGLMRFDEEYKSRFMISPTQVVVFLAVIAVFVVALRVLWPVLV